MKHETVTGALIALVNSGVLDTFGGMSLIKMDEVARWMFENDATPEQAAEHFDVN